MATRTKKLQAVKRPAEGPKNPPAQSPAATVPKLTSKDIEINERRKVVEEERRATWRRPAMFELASLVASVSGPKLVGQDNQETVKNVLRMWEGCGDALRDEIDAHKEYLRIQALDNPEEETRGPFPIEFELALRQIFDKRRQPERYRLLRECLRDIEAQTPTLLGEHARAKPSDLNLRIDRAGEIRSYRASKECEAAIDKRFADLREAGFPRHDYFRITVWFIERQDRLMREKASKGGKALRAKREAEKKLKNSLGQA